MRRLRVALFVKPSPATVKREDRNMGYWSYPVDEFTWEHFPHHGEAVDLGFFRHYDLVFHEDAGFCTYTNRHKGPPVVYLSIDSTLSDDHYKVRREQAKQADLVLVDHDRLERFNVNGKKAKRLAFCVNDLIFHPVDGKDCDIAFHCSAGSRNSMPGALERSELRGLLGEYAKGCGYTYRSGAWGLTEYAQSMAAARVTVNLPRTASNRPHRVFDAMACRSALLTRILPDVDGDHRQPGYHYWEFADYKEPAFKVALGKLLDDWWLETAENGYKLVVSQHTWKVRARELREMLGLELGL